MIGKTGNLIISMMNIENLFHKIRYQLFQINPTGNRAYFLLLALSSFAFTLPHPFHLSKCELEYSHEEKALQISLHLFIDDLEVALRQQGADQLFICTKKEAEKAEHYMLKYLQQRFKIEVDGKEKTYQLLGKEISKDLAGVWCYLEIPNIEAIKQLKIQNQLLLEVFDDQKNIVHIRGPKGKKGGLIFGRGKGIQTVDF